MISVSTFVSLDPSSLIVTCVTTAMVMGTVTVETEYGNERKNSSATTLHPGHVDDVEDCTEDGLVQLFAAKL